MKALKALRLGPLLLAGSAMGVMATAASAQTATATNAGTAVGEVIVTAQHRAERLRDVPITISSVTADQLQRSGVRDLTDLQSVVPGVRIDLAGNYVQPAIRGVSASVIGASTDAPVAIYVDGVYQPDQLANHFEFADLSRIEVDKGPQGTLYGREATGGAIAIFTKSPSFTTTGDFLVGYGNYKDFIAKGFLAGPLVGDKLAGSIAAYFERHDDYNYDVARNLRPKGLNARSVRGKLLFKPVEWARFTFGLYYQDWYDSNAGEALPYNGNTVGNLDPGTIITTKPHTISFNTPSFLHVRDFSGTLNSQFDTPYGTVTSITDVTHGWNYLLFDEDRSYDLLNGLAYDNYSRDNHESEDLSFTSKKFGQFSFIAGASYFHDDNHYSPLHARGGPNIPGTFLSPVVTILVSHNPVLSYAVFGEGTYDITNRLTLTGGLRYTWEHRGNSGYLALPLFGLVLTGPPVATKFTALTGRASLRYRVNDATNVYFTFSQGFKSGGQDATGFLMQHPPYKPETINAYEVGVKSNVTPRINLNASIYYYDYADLQVQVNHGGANGNFIQNAATARIYGLDFDTTAHVTDEFTVTAALNLLNAKYVTFPNASVEAPCTVYYSSLSGCMPITGPTNGNQTIVLPSLAGYAMPRAPKVTFTLTGDYRKIISAGTFDLNGTLYYSSRVWFDSNERISQPPYATLALQASWQPTGSHFKFEVWAKNITNEDYITSVYEDGPADGVNYAPQTTGGVDIRYSF
jgi:iron complex outermembrane receptor protein